jgi:hypothetical protein
LESGKIELYKGKCKYVINALSLDSTRLVADYGKIDEIFTHYEKYKEIIHKHMPYKDSFTKTEPLMDNHKIAAAFFCSFLKARPLSYVPDGSGVAPSFREQRANEQGAFVFGLQVMQDYWEDKFYDSVDAYDREIYQKAINLPKTDHDSYIHWFINLFIYGGVTQYFDYESEKFEELLIFFVSHIYAMLENYSYQYHKAILHENRAEYLNHELTELKKRFQIER